MARRGGSRRPPSLRGTGGGEGIFGLISGLLAIVAMAVWWYGEILRQHGEGGSPNRASSGQQLADRRRRAAEIAELKEYQRRIREEKQRAHEAAQFEARQ